jgi:hypothetical protein
MFYFQYSPYAGAITLYADVIGEEKPPRADLKYGGIKPIVGAPREWKTRTCPIKSISERELSH